jgi:predicted O-linked N-acetylglucosamine transferase (SPINDLY family)
MHKDDIQQNHIDALNQMGERYRQSGRLEKAAQYFQKALALNKSYAPVHANLAAYFLQINNPTQALNHAKRAEIQLDGDAQFLYHYGLIYIALNKIHQAANYFTKVLNIAPEHYGAIINLSLIKMLLGEIKDAESMLLDRNKAFPNEYNTLINLGFCCEQQCLIDQAIDFYQQAALTGDNNKINAYSGQVFLRHYQWNSTSETLYKHHCTFSEQLKKKNVYQFNIEKYLKQPKINIGYVSPDFRKHPVGNFIYPILKNHNQSLFNVYCFSSTEQMDSMSEKIKDVVFQWTDINSLSNEAICNEIHKESIHILVDLAGHTKSNRIEVFAMKPAPIQMSYLGYPGTTGLSQIDYRITDSWADPPGEGKYYAEQLVRMPNCFLCYHPDLQISQPSGLPSEKNGWITFGSFNRMPKMNNTILEIWASILKRLKKSRLLLKTKAFKDPDIQKKIKKFFENKGIESNRLILLQFSPTQAQHFSLYNQMDIALDTYPYHGTTTTCEALFMGVPVITLKGQVHVSRASVSILHNVGLQDCIANTPEEYMYKAIQMASNIPLLRQIRQQLRTIVISSSLCDTQNYISDLERKYLWMWNQYPKNN